MTNCGIFDGFRRLCMRATQLLPALATVDHLPLMTRIARRSQTPLA
jgi:hypothetical protein